MLRTQGELNIPSHSVKVITKNVRANLLAFVVVKGLINSLYFYMYASSRSINTNYCTKLRMNRYWNPRHQRKIPLLGISENNLFYKNNIIRCRKEYNC